MGSRVGREVELLEGDGEGSAVAGARVEALDREEDAGFVERGAEEGGYTRPFAGEDAGADVADGCAVAVYRGEAEGFGFNVSFYLGGGNKTEAGDVVAIELCENLFVASESVAATESLLRLQNGRGKGAWIGWVGEQLLH